MKKLLSALSVLCLLTACGSSANSGSTATAAAEPQSPQATAASAAPVQETEPAPEPRAHMENYECMEVAFLGITNQSTTPLDVIENARVNFPGFSWLSAIETKDIINGELSEETNNVYVILPAETTDLKIGKYNWYAGEITDVYYDQKNSGPVVFVENGEAVSPLSRIEFVRHVNDNASDDGIYTGFSLASDKLRTDYHMGTVDTTPYDRFSSAEVPFYKQYLFDTLNSFDEIKDALDKGSKLAVMDEMFYDGIAYAIYDLEKPDGNHVGYAVTSDPSAAFKVMYSPDFKDWSPLGQG